MEKKVLAGSPEDKRWPAPIDADRPQIIKPKPKKDNVLKNVRDDNLALKLKLGDINTKNAELVAENQDVVKKLEKLQKENKELKNQLTTVKKEAQDVVKATATRKRVQKKSNMSRKSTSKK